MPAGRRHSARVPAATPRRGPHRNAAGRAAAHTRIVTVIDGHPATLAWLGAVAGHQTFPLGVEHFGQTGTIGDLYHHFGIDAEAIVERVNALTAGKRLN
jgi:pyruvate dehydrogenase E1 component